MHGSTFHTKKLSKAKWRYVLTSLVSPFWACYFSCLRCFLRSEMCYALSKHIIPTIQFYWSCWHHITLCRMSRDALFIRNDDMSESRLYNRIAKIQNMHCTPWGQFSIRRVFYVNLNWKQRRCLSPLKSQKCHTPCCKHQGSQCDLMVPIVM